MSPGPRHTTYACKLCSTACRGWLRVSVIMCKCYFLPYFSLVGCPVSPSKRKHKVRGIANDKRCTLFVAAGAMILAKEVTSRGFLLAIVFDNLSVSFPSLLFLHAKIARTPKKLTTHTHRIHQFTSKLYARTGTSTSRFNSLEAGRSGRHRVRSWQRGVRCKHDVGVHWHVAMHAHFFSCICFSYCMYVKPVDTHITARSVRCNTYTYTAALLIFLSWAKMVHSENNLRRGRVQRVGI